MARPKIYLMRHGEIETGGKLRFVGHIDLPLTEKGTRQGEYWNRQFKETEWSAVWSSDLSRCADFAKIVTAAESSSINIASELREVALGEWEGRAVSDVVQEYPGDWSKRGASMVSYNDHGGESFRDMSERVVPFYDNIVEQSEGNILIVAHSGVNRAIVCHILGLPLAGLFRFGQDYGCLNIIQWDRTAWQVSALNVRPLFSPSDQH